MALYQIQPTQVCSPGRIVETNRLEFGGLTVEYNPRRNRFYLRDPHCEYRSAILYESDFPTFLAFALDRFVPFDGSIQRRNELPDAYDRLCKATHLLERVLNDVRNWTSKHCIDCVSQRDRVDQARRVLDLVLSGVSGDTLIDVRCLNQNEVQLRAEACGLSDAIQDYVTQRRAIHRKKGIN